MGVHMSVLLKFFILFLGLAFTDLFAKNLLPGSYALADNNYSYNLFIQVLPDRKTSFLALELQYKTYLLGRDFENARFYLIDKIKSDLYQMTELKNGPLDLLATSSNKESSFLLTILKDQDGNEILHQTGNQFSAKSYDDLTNAYSDYQWIPYLAGKYDNGNTIVSSINKDSGDGLVTASTTSFSVREERPLIYRAHANDETDYSYYLIFLQNRLNTFFISINMKTQNANIFKRD